MAADRSGPDRHHIRSDRGGFGRPRAVPQSRALRSRPGAVAAFGHLDGRGRCRLSVGGDAGGPESFRRTALRRPQAPDRLRNGVGQQQRRCPRPRRALAAVDRHQRRRPGSHRPADRRAATHRRRGGPAASHGQPRDAGRRRRRLAGHRSWSFPRRCRAGSGPAAGRHGRRGRNAGGFARQYLRAGCRLRTLATRTGPARAHTAGTHP